MQGEGGGPRTADGKLVSSRNAIRHGLHSVNPVVTGFESQAEWDEFLRDICDELQPDGRLERELAERAALVLWRLRRITRYETGILIYLQDTLEENLATLDAYIEGTLVENILPPVAPEVLEAARPRVLLPDPSVTDRIGRYESHLQRQYRLIVQDLRDLQDRRRGCPAPVLRLDLTGDGA